MIKTFFSCLFVLCLWAATASADGFHLQFDGKWWVKQTNEEKFEFIRGEEYCYTKDFRGKVYFNQYTGDVVDLVDKYYSSDMHNSGEKLLPVLRVIAERNHKTVHYDPHAEHYTADSMFDLGYWDQMSYANIRLAFVEGYLSCRSEYLNDEIKQPATYYEANISKYIYADYDGNDPKILKFIRKRSGEPIRVRILLILRGRE